MRWHWLGFIALLIVCNGSTRAQSPLSRPMEPTRSGSRDRPSAPSPAGDAVFGGSAQNPLFGGVRSGEITPGELPLSLSDAIERGLRNNLGGILSGESRRAAEGARVRLLSELLPKLTARHRERTAGQPGRLWISRNSRHSVRDRPFPPLRWAGVSIAIHSQF